MDELLGEFVAECHDLLETLAVEMVEWERDPSDQQRLDTVFRFFHTVKGNCGFFDFPRLEKLSHAAEDLLSDFRADRRKPDRAAVDAVLATIDKIRELVGIIDAGQPLPEDDDAELIAALRSEGEAPVAEDGEASDEVIEDTAEEPAPAAETTPKKDAAPSTPVTQQQRTIRLPVELLDRVMSGVSDMALARNELNRMIAMQVDDPQVQATFSRLSTLLDEMRDAIQRIRMQRVDTLFASFPRLVRDLSHELGKQVMVELESGDVELDRELIEVIRDPLMHLLRNAVDHGIESPAERLEAGKREIGMLHVSARQTGSEIRIGIVDDGRGIDTEKLVEKAIAKGIITAEEAEMMSERDKTALICEPGFSTAEKVTSISGRGVGMDVVRANIENIGGSLVIDTSPGSGTRMMLNVPMTLSIVPAITVRSGGRPFALPRSYVQEIVRVNADDSGRARMGGRDFITLDDKRMPCVELADILEMDSDLSELDERLFLIVRLVGGDAFALGVEEIVGLGELVIKPVAPMLQKTGFYVGITQMDDGSPVMALDVSGIARDAGMIGDVKKRVRVSEEAGKERAEVLHKGLLFEQFDGAMRLVAMDSIHRIERVASSQITPVDNGYRVAIDGSVMPVGGLLDEMPGRKRLELLHFHVGGRSIAHAFARMIDIVEFKAPTGGERDVVLVDEKPVRQLHPEQMADGLTAVVELES
ncbi:chemotaxis protein CheA [Alteraurantiacibacter aquimixticola]|nr:chemotaxis protein CheA [Alteraurantiacibacter aquimixticola]